MMTIQCKARKRKVTQTVGKDDELTLGYVICYKEYRMFDEKGKVVKIWDLTEIDVQDCWNFKKFDDLIKEE